MRRTLRAGETRLEGFTKITGRDRRQKTNIRPTGAFEIFEGGSRVARAREEREREISGLTPFYLAGTISSSFVGEST